MSDADLAAFVLSRSVTSRGGRDRVLAAQHLKPGTSEHTLRADEWDRTPRLGSPKVQAVALEALKLSLGPTLSGDELFPATFWRGGVTQTYDGEPFLGSTSTFAHFLRRRAEVVAPKRTGWVVTPTDNSDGHRCNESTEAVHALFLDCDGRGTPDVLLALLDSLGVAHVFYESGGHTPEVPKWRLVLPLARPWPCPDESAREAWREAYSTARTVFGALGDLLGEGFDATTDTGAAPLFLTERRIPDAPERRVLWHPGRALDLQVMVAALPPREAPVRVAEREPRVARRSNIKVDAIVEALLGPMTAILEGRRDLYLCLPGALLDKGVSPDDVLAIVEEVSLACPGDPGLSDREVDDRHAEHLHCARTTISRHESGSTYTRIGTLMERWPEVAQAVDRALPSAMALKVEEMRAGWAREDAERAALAATEQTSATSARPIEGLDLAPIFRTSSSATNQKVLSVEEELLKELRKKIGARRRTFASRVEQDAYDEDAEIKATLLRRLLRGEPLVAAHDSSMSTRTAVRKCAAMLAWAAPVGTRVDAIVKVMYRSLQRMGGPDATVEDLLALADTVYVVAAVEREEQERLELEALKAQRARIRTTMFGGSR